MDLTEEDRRRLRSEVERIIEKDACGRDELLDQVGRLLTAAIERARPEGRATSRDLDPVREDNEENDDNEDNRYTLTQRLKREGYVNVTTARNGREALDVLRSRPFDLVLLDIMSHDHRNVSEPPVGSGAGCRRARDPDGARHA